MASISSGEIPNFLATYSLLLRRARGVKWWALQDLQRLFAGDLPRADLAGQRGPPVVDVELDGQDVRLHEARDRRLEVLASVVLPPELVLELLHGLRLRVLDVVEHVHEPDALEELVVGLLDEAEGRERAELAAPEPPMDRSQEADVLGVVVPRAGQDALGCVVASHEDEADAVLRRNAVERRGNGDVRGRLDLRHGCPEEGELQVPELLPVEHDALVVDPKRPSHVLDVLGRRVGVPAVVHVHAQRAQTKALDHIRGIGAVDATAETDDAVVFLPAPRGLDALDDGRQLALARPRPVGEVGDPIEIVRAVVAAAFGVERDVRVGGGHDAARAYLPAAVVPLFGRGGLRCGHAFRNFLRTGSRPGRGS